MLPSHCGLLLANYLNLSAGEAHLPVHDVYLHQGGPGLPVTQNRELLPPSPDLLATGNIAMLNWKGSTYVFELFAGYPEGPRVQGAVRLRLPSLPQGGGGGEKAGFQLVRPARLCSDHCTLHSASTVGPIVVEV